MLRLAIVDDNPNDSAALRALVADYLTRNNHAHVIQVFNAPLDFIRSTENHDIVFMDIRMDKLDGLEVARIMRKINTDSVLVFVTAMAQLAIKGYEVDALDFIVKPADQFSINYVLTKALTRLENTSSTVFALKTSDGIVSLSSNDITYVEVFDHNLRGQSAVCVQRMQRASGGGREEDLHLQVPQQGDYEAFLQLPG